MSSHSSTPSAEPLRLAQLRHCWDSLKGQAQPAACSSAEQVRKTPEQLKRDAEKYDVCAQRGAARVAVRQPRALHAGERWKRCGAGMMTVQ